MRRITRYFVIFIAAIVIAVAGIRLYRNAIEQKRQIFLKTLVENLDSYKSMHGRYPAELPNLMRKGSDWLNYAVDSAGQHFFLTYSSGIMNINSRRYSSMTRRWDGYFNY